MTVIYQVMKMFQSVRQIFEAHKICFYYFSSSSCTRPVRVRFAPSPTGNLHLGGLRTALYNYLFARKHGGKFVLRIEDTDQNRLVPGTVEKLHEILNWIGIAPDESPEFGGPYGPYVQSQRVNLYRENIKHLLETGAAYRCFCSESRLDLIRKEALRNREVPRYDNRCKYLTPSEIGEHLKNNHPYTVRFKLENGPLTFDDIVYGSTTFNISETEGDFIILKSDGFPTYHLASVVDDHFMDISHVLRGIEWQPSTPKHFMLYKAFKWAPPEFAHLPLLLNSDGSKLSKRQGDIDVEIFKKQGYSPEAILNFLTLAGGGFGKQYNYFIMDLHEMAMKFDLSAVNTNSCKLDLEKLRNVSHAHLMKQLSDEQSTQILIEKTKDLLHQTYGSRWKAENKPFVFNDSYIKRILLIYKDRISHLSELMTPEMNFLWISPNISSAEVKHFEFNAVVELKKLSLWVDSISESDFVETKLATQLKELCKEQGLKYSSVMQMLRFVLSGLKQGPKVAEILFMLGQKQTLQRLISAVQKLELEDN